MTESTKLSLSRRAAAWYDAAYRRWAAAGRTGYRWRSHELNTTGDRAAAIAARYARLASR